MQLSGKKTHTMIIDVSVENVYRYGEKDVWGCELFILSSHRNEVNIKYRKIANHLYEKFDGPFSSK